MKWLYDNWSMLVVIACAISLVVIYVTKFVEMPTREQIYKVKQWLLYAVIEAERQYKGGTGVLKLRATYNEFCRVFPNLAPIIPFDLFADLVDESLERMKHLLETNLEIADYVEGKE